MAAVAGQLGPLPSAVYGSSTMTAADLYPAHVGIGGIRSSDWSIPAFGERMAAAQSRATAIGAAEDQVTLRTPAGWLAFGIVTLIVLSWALAKR